MAINPTLVTYDSIATDIADAVGLTPDTVVGGQVTWTENNRRKIARFATAAARWAYYPANAEVKWPGLLVGASISLSSGAFHLSQVDYSDQFTLWSEDPRPVNSNAFSINATISGFYVYPATTLATVFAIYVPRPPEFTTTQWLIATAYILDDLVYDSTTGRCYRCILANTGQAVTNTTYWLPQDVLKILNEAIMTKAASTWQNAGGNEPDIARSNNEAAQYELDRAWVRAKKYSNDADYNYLVSSMTVSVTPLNFNPGYWTALTGGLQTCLDFVPTASGAVITGTTVETAISGIYNMFQLQDSVAAADGIWVVEPLDYNVSTNARKWIRIA